MFHQRDLVVKVNYDVQWSHYFTITHGTMKMWSHTAGGLKLIATQIHTMRPCSYNKGGFKIGL